MEVTEPVERKTHSMHERCTSLENAAGVLATALYDRERACTQYALRTRVFESSNKSAQINVVPSKKERSAAVSPAPPDVSTSLFTSALTRINAILS